jgi:biopolymer transport protein ExbB
MFFPLSFIGEPARQAAVSFFVKGGPVMWPLLACSLLATAIAFERLFYYWRESAASRRHASATSRAIGLAARGLFDEAEKLAQQNPSREGRLAHTALTHRDMVLHEGLETCALSELDKLRRGLTVLDTVVTLAPMLGILGTVTGIITSFDMLSSSGMQNPTGVVAGIAEALITTAAGLIISMFALVPFNAFTSHIRRVTRGLEQTAHLLEVACARGMQTTPK